MPARIRPPRAGLPGSTRCREAIDLTPGVVEETGADRDRFLAGLLEPEEKAPTQTIGVEINTREHGNTKAFRVSNVVNVLRALLDLKRRVG